MTESSTLNWNAIFDGPRHQLQLYTTLSAKILWKLWWFGDASRGYPPYRNLKGKHFKKEAKPRVSEFRKLMKHFEQFVRTKLKAIPKTEVEADEMYFAIENEFNLLSLEGYTNDIRPEQRSWRTVHKRLFCKHYLVTNSNN